MRSMQVSEEILEKINQSALKFLIPLTPEETYEVIVREAVKLVKAQYGSIYLEQNGILKRVYTNFPFLKKVTIRKRGYTYKSFKTQASYVLEGEKAKNIHPELGKTSINSTIFIPLSYRGKAIGVLSIDSLRKKHFNTKELRTLKLFGSLATLAIRKTQLYSETKNALEIRDLFMTMAAHELRTPLTTISGYAQLLQKKLSSTKSTDVKLVEKLFVEIRRLTQLVNELLEVNQAKIGALRYNFKECNIQKVVERTINNFSVSYPKRKIRFQSHFKKKKPIIMGDFDKLLQAISNILVNAIKFSPVDSSILITFSQKLDCVVLRIVDQGIGITTTDLPKIFNKFYKGEDNQRSGLGLGMFMVKSIIDKHKGKISVSSTFGSGTTIKIILPLVKT